MEEAIILVQGKVQGVFFRGFVQQQARLLGVNGYAKNLPDGSVEVVAQGSKGAVAELISKCHEGPPGATIQDVRVTWRLLAQELRRFEIR